MTTLKLPEKQPWMKTAVELPELPWAKNALEPVISAKTIDFRYGKHHNAYVLKTLELTKGTELEGQTLEMIMVVAAADPSKKGLYNNAAQIWKSHLLLEMPCPLRHGENPQPRSKPKFEKDFGSWEESANS